MMRSWRRAVRNRAAVAGVEDEGTDQVRGFGSLQSSWGAVTKSRPAPAWQHGEVAIRSGQRSLVQRLHRKCAGGNSHFPARPEGG